MHLKGYRVLETISQRNTHQLRQFSQFDWQSKKDMGAHLKTLVHGCTKIITIGGHNGGNPGLEEPPFPKEKTPSILAYARQQSREERHYKNKFIRLLERGADDKLLKWNRPFNFEHSILISRKTSRGLQEKQQCPFCRNVDREPRQKRK